MKKETRVPGDSDRDQSIDRLLKQALPGAGTPPSAACLDAETLAAWSEGALAISDAGAVEMHLSTCGRCQAMLAAFARTEPVVTAAAPFWQRWSVRWLIPLTVAAAAVVWFVSPKQTSSPVANQQFAKAEPPVTPSSASPVLETKAQPLAEPPSAPTATHRAAPPPSAAGLPPPPAPKPTPPLPPPPTPVVVAEPPPQPVTTPPVTAPPVTAGAASDAGRPLPIVRAQSELTEAPAGRIVEIIAPSPAADQPPAPAAAGAGGGGGGRGGAGAAGAMRGGGAIAAFSSTVNVPARWRILPTGRVERSTDGGASWISMAIDPPAPLTGGAAASSTICWLIGHGGVILRAVDGVHFERLKFSENVDLVSIRSTGAAQATVTTADGRVFVTTDGGLTWRLQGFSTSSF